MKVKDVIKNMQNYNPEDEVVVLWWTKDIFDNENTLLLDDTWIKVVKEIEDDRLDFPSQVISEDIIDALSSNGVIA
jgi:hypothetical protein